MFYFEEVQDFKLSVTYFRLEGQTHFYDILKLKSFYFKHQCSLIYSLILEVTKNLHHLCSL